ncbi:unnamed protein product [Sphagnum troendelagicum]|uniref:Core Histone H2A/H2B/H3 domain-containing protein n=1 Tax=Sphagnum troendelagicum TaxID=128251 RepID=A0ABP0UHJ4_9BRYO
MQQSQYYQQPQAIASSVPEGSPAQAQQGQANYPTTVAQQQQQLTHHHLQQHQQQQLQMFWQGQMSEIEQVNDFKNHQLPLARIKKIMKADEDVRMISAEAPVLFAKACEMFILELTLRSWIHTEENKRRTLQKNDIAAAITRTDIFDFLVDIVPRDELINKEDVGLQGMMQHLLPQQQQAMGSPSTMGSAMMVARPTMAMDPSLYQQQQQQQQSYIPQQQPMQQNLWHQQAHMANSQAGMPPNS